MRGEHPVRVAEHGAGPEPRDPPLVLDRDRGEVAADVDEDPFTLRLAVEAGAGGAKGQRHAGSLRERDQLGDIVRVGGENDSLGKDAVGARVGGVADQVDYAREHAILAEQLDQPAAERLRRTAGELAGDSIRRRLVATGGDLLRIRGEQGHSGQD